MHSYKQATANITTYDVGTRSNLGVTPGTGVVLIYTKEAEDEKRILEHLAKLELVFIKMRENRLYGKLSKSFFGLPEVPLVGTYSKLAWGTTGSWKDSSSSRVATASERKRATSVSGICQLVSPVYARLFTANSGADKTHKKESTLYMDRGTR